MSSKTLSKKASIVRGALLAVAPRMLAADSQIDLNAVLAGVKRKNWLDKKPGIVAAIKPHLAKDADIKDIVELLDKLDNENPEDDNLGQDAPDEKMDGIMNMLRGKISDEDLSEIEAMLKAKPVGEVKQATDEPAQTANAANANPKDATNKEEIGAKDNKEEKMDKAAMDKAIKLACDAAAKNAEEKTIVRLRGIAEAEEIVRPYVGKLTAMDSAEAVYAAALAGLGKDVKGVHPSAYKAIITSMPKPGEKQTVQLASDSAASADFSEIFPDSNRVR